MSKVDIPIVDGAIFTRIEYDTCADEYVVKTHSGEVRSMPRWVLEDHPETDPMLEKQRQVMLKPRHALNQQIGKNLSVLLT